MSDRNRGAIAVTLDPNALLEAGRAQLAIQHPDYDPKFLTNGPLPQMLLPVNRGQAAIVNNEGFGTIATEECTIEVSFTYDGYLLINLELNLDDEVADAATENKIDLADGIRTFGSRLDSNHYGWWCIYDRNQ